MENNDEFNDLDNLNNEEIEQLFGSIIEGPQKIIACKNCYYWSQWDYWSYYQSDKRLKEIFDENNNGLEHINAIKIYNYIYKNDRNKIPHVGVIAQEIQEIFPKAVRKNENGYLMIKNEDIFFAMVNSIKELSKKNELLEKRIEKFESLEKARV